MKIINIYKNESNDPYSTSFLKVEKDGKKYEVPIATYKTDYIDKSGHDEQLQAYLRAMFWTKEQRLAHRNALDELLPLARMADEGERLMCQGYGAEVFGEMCQPQSEHIAKYNKILGEMWHSVSPNVIYCRSAREVIED